MLSISAEIALRKAKARSLSNQMHSKLLLKLSDQAN